MIEAALQSAARRSRDEGFRRRLTSALAEVKARRAGRSQNPAILEQLAQTN